MSTTLTVIASLPSDPALRSYRDTFRNDVPHRADLYPDEARSHTELREKQIIRLAASLIMSALLFQRFVIPIGGSVTSVVGPIGYVIACYGMIKGLLTLDRWRLTLWLMLGALATLGAALNLAAAPPFVTPMSMLSGMQMLVISCFATLKFTVPVNEARMFRMVNMCLAVIAVAGIVQFLLQFVGLPFFHFHEVIPPRLLTEYLAGGAYNNEIPITYGSPWFKSNGFFMIEPSTFSQMMAIAIAVEIMFFRRFAFLSVYFLGLLMSISGTGWIVLGVFFVTFGLTTGWRGVLLVASTFLAVGVLLFLWSIILPDFFQAFAGRSGEITEVGSSGYIRFISPFIIADAILTRAPMALLYGVGFGLSEQVPLPMDSGIISPVKIALENGLPALLCYTLLITIGQQTPRQLRLMPAILALLFVTGGYVQFPPVVFPLVMIMSIAVLKTSPTGGDPQHMSLSKSLRSA